MANTLISIAQTKIEENFGYICETYFPESVEAYLLEKAASPTSDVTIDRSSKDILHLKRQFERSLDAISEMQGKVTSMSTQFNWMSALVFFFFATLFVTCLRLL